MDASVFLALALACAPQVHADTARALVSVESALNPWAIGVVGGALVRQPRHRAEALATAKALRDAGQRRTSREWFRPEPAPTPLVPSRWRRHPAKPAAGAPLRCG